MHNDEQAGNVTLPESQSVASLTRALCCEAFKHVLFRQMDKPSRSRSHDTMALGTTTLHVLKSIDPAKGDVMLCDPGKGKRTFK